MKLHQFHGTYTAPRCGAAFCFTHLTSESWQRARQPFLPNSSTSCGAALIFKKSSSIVFALSWRSHFSGVCTWVQAHRLVLGGRCLFLCRGSSKCEGKSERVREAPRAVQPCRGRASSGAQLLIFQKRRTERSFPFCVGGRPVVAATHR